MDSESCCSVWLRSNWALDRSSFKAVRSSAALCLSACASACRTEAQQLVKAPPYRSAAIPKHPLQKLTAAMPFRVREVEGFCG